MKEIPPKYFVKLLTMHYISLVCSIGLVYIFYFWNGSLYNALVVEESKTVKDWLFIIASIGIFPLVFGSFVLNAKSIWALFEFDHFNNSQTMQDDLVKINSQSSLAE